MDVKINTFLMIDHKFMPEIRLNLILPIARLNCLLKTNKQTKKKTGIKAFKEKADSRYINRNELDRACF